MNITQLKIDLNILRIQTIEESEDILQDAEHYLSKIDAIDTLLEYLK